MENSSNQQHTEFMCQVTVFNLKICGLTKRLQLNKTILALVSQKYHTPTVEFANLFSGG